MHWAQLCLQMRTLTSTVPRVLPHYIGTEPAPLSSPLHWAPGAMGVGGSRKVPGQVSARKFAMC